jgi:hypothetical protein
VDVLGNRDGASGGCWVRGEGKGLQAFDSNFLEIVIGSDNLEQMGSTEKRT